MGVVIEISKGTEKEPVSFYRSSKRPVPAKVEKRTSFLEAVAMVGVSALVVMGFVHIAAGIIRALPASAQSVLSKFGNFLVGN